MRRIALLVVVLIVLAAFISVAVWAQTEKKAESAKTVAPAKTVEPVKKIEPAKKIDRTALLQKFKAAPTDAVVAVVNGEKITKQKLMDALWEWNAPMVLDELIQQKIVWQAAQKKGVKLTAEDVNKRIEETKNRIPPGQELEEALMRYNFFTMPSFLARMRASLMAEKVVKQDINPTDADYAQFIKARHILVRVQVADTEDNRKKNEEAAKEKIEKIAAEIKGGLDFAEAAKKYSEDDSNKDKGGDLGWFERGRMAEEFETAAFAMKPGEISEPVKTFYGYHLINVEKVGKDATLEEKKDFREQIVRKQMSTQLPQWFQNAKTNAKVENLLNPKVEETNTSPAPKPAPALRTAPKPAPKTEVKPAE